MRRARLIGILVAVVLGFGLFAWWTQSSLVECDTDTDCMEKNGGDGGPDPA